MSNSQSHPPSGDATPEAKADPKAGHADDVWAKITQGLQVGRATSGEWSMAAIYPDVLPPIQLSLHHDNRRAGHEGTAVSENPSSAAGRLSEGQALRLYNAKTVRLAYTDIGLSPHRFNSLGVSVVEQGKYGDCFFVSAMASLAASPNGLAVIKNMIKPGLHYKPVSFTPAGKQTFTGSIADTDGSYVVTFPGDKQHPVTVTQADLVKYGCINEAPWANIIETAFLKLDKANRQGGNDAIPPGAPVYLPEDALRIMTGHAVASVTIPGTAKATLEHDIEQALRHGEPITASSAALQPKVPDTGVVPVSLAAPDIPVVSNHQYSVMAYDPKTQTVTLRNPWGYAGSDLLPGKTRQNGGGVTDKGNGEISMSMDRFMQYFVALDIARHPPETGDLWNWPVPV